MVNGNTGCHIPKVSGHFEPGNIYANPKIDKNTENPPIRPIISQIGTINYSTAKIINSIIAPYTPKK